MKKQEVSVELRPINIQRIALKLVGDSPLIVHQWSKKAKKEILDKHMKKASRKKAAKDPFRDYVDSLYFMNGTDPAKIKTQGQLAKLDFGVPAIAFKGCAVDACSQVEMTKVLARSCFHVVGELVKIKGRPKMREDMVRVGMGKPDIRFRAEFWPWSTVLEIRYNADVLSAEQIVNLFNLGGFGIGLCEWRPQKNGQYGMFHVEAS